jgi:hypothetical protein
MVVVVVAVVAVVVGVVVTTDRFLLLQRHLLFGAIGCILALVVILGSHPRRLPFILVFNRIKGDGVLEVIFASLYGVTGVTVKRHRRPFQKARDGSVALAAFIPESHRLIFKHRFRLHSSDGQLLPIATVFLSSDGRR